MPRRWPPLQLPPSLPVFAPSLPPPPHPCQALILPQPWLPLHLPMPPWAPAQLGPVWQGPAPLPSLWRSPERAPVRKGGRRVSAPTAGSFPWWVGTLRKAQSCPTAFGVGEGSRRDKGLEKLPREQGPRKLPRNALAPAWYPLVLPLEHSGFLAQAQINLLFPWISQVKLGALTRNFPRKQLMTRTKHKKGHTKACPRVLPKDD